MNRTITHHQLIQQVSNFSESELRLIITVAMFHLNEKAIERESSTLEQLITEFNQL